MNHETLEQAIDQWLKQHEKGIAHEHESAIAIHAFKAGASWREQQASSGWEDAVKKVLEIDADDHLDWGCCDPDLEDLSKGMFVAGELSSAKLLAEKDKEIEELKEYKAMYEGLCK